MSEENLSLDQLCINTLRLLAVDMVQKANSGHPGLPMGAAPMAYVLWQRHLRHNPADPKWTNRDRFVLSPGHGSALLYSLLHLTGYGLSLQDLQAFRQWKSLTPGHPESTLTAGVEATTGPLGQGASNAVGMALAERMLANLFNRPGHSIVDHRTYAIVSDGDLMEGVVAEAASLAGHLKLGKLTYLYDSNNITLNGPTSLSFSTENVAKRFESYGWHVQVVEKGDTDIEALDKALEAAKAETDRPSMIVVQTTIGYGSPHKHGTSGVHGSPLGKDELALTKQTLGFDPEKFFFVPDQALAQYRKALTDGQAAQKAWDEQFAAYEKAYPELAAQWRLAQAGKLPVGWDKALPQFKAGEEQATRVSSGKIINAIAPEVPWLIGGDADISASTNSEIKGAGWFNGETGRNIAFGIREHAMAAIANGMMYHGGVRAFVSTFFTFADYMRPSMRVASLAELPVIYVFTHDSVAVGEDGPTHQPVEHLASLRCIPNMTMLRPADANESAEAWRFALEHTHGPVALAFTRQNLPILDRQRYHSADGLRRGAYVLADCEGTPQALLLATGSEVSLAVEAHEQLAQKGIRTRVISMPSWEVFAKQPESYRNEVLPKEVKARVAVEAGVSFGWDRWVGSEGTVLSIDTFGASAPAPTVLKNYGMSTENVMQAVMALLQRSSL